MRLRLECIRMAQSLLPREKLPRGPRWPHTPGAPPGQVMKLARELYGWISGGRPPPGGKSANCEKIMRRTLGLADRELYREFKRKEEASRQAHLKEERDRVKRAERRKLRSAAAGAPASGAMGFNPSEKIPWAP